MVPDGQYVYDPETTRKINALAERAKAFQGQLMPLADEIYELCRALGEPRLAARALMAGSDDRPAGLLSVLRTLSSSTLVTNPDPTREAKPQA